MVITAKVTVAPGAAVAPLAISNRSYRTGIALADRSAVIVASATAAATATPATASATPGTAIIVAISGVCVVAVPLTARLASCFMTRCIDCTVIVEAGRTIAFDTARPLVVAAATAVVVRASGRSLEPAFFTGRQVVAAAVGSTVPVTRGRLVDRWRWRT